MSKAREWWIRIESASSPQIFNAHPNDTNFQIKDVVHVIEYSAFE